jgi:hypothetical protein
MMSANGEGCGMVGSTTNRVEGEGRVKWERVRHPAPRANRIVVGVVGAAAVAAVGFVGWQWFLSLDRELSEKPTRSGSPEAYPMRTSTIQTSVEIPFTALASAANKAADQFAKPQAGSRIRSTMSTPRSPASQCGPNSTKSGGRGPSQ